MWDEIGLALRLFPATAGTAVQILNPGCLHSSSDICIVVLRRQIVFIANLRASLRTILAIVVIVSTVLAITIRIATMWSRNLTMSLK